VYNVRAISRAVGVGTKDCQAKSQQSYLLCHYHSTTPPLIRQGGLVVVSVPTHRYQGMMKVPEKSGAPLAES